LSFIDLITIDVQYLNAEKYVDQDEAQNPFQPTPADQQIMADKSYYRVFDLREGLTNITNTSPTSYFHRNIAGYNPAKLSIYQDIIENQLYKFPNCQPVLDMLNTKYLLIPTNTGRDSVAQNPGALGPVWLVKAVSFAQDPKAVMEGLTTLNARDTALLFAKDQSAVSATATGTPGATDSIWLTKNDNDEMTYQSKTAAPRFAVFSEVYYNRGWKAYIDEKEVPIYRTNFVLRGLTLPAGEHAIRFDFHPASYYTSKTFQIIASLILWIMLGLTAYQAFQATKKKPANVKKP
jgi:hypothetical protein